MRVPRFLLSAFPSLSVSDTRRGRAGSDFHPLAASDVSDANFQQRTNAATNFSSTSRSGTERLIPGSSRQMLEMQSMQVSALAEDSAKLAPLHNSSNLENTSRDSGIANTNGNGDQVLDSFQVYNAPSVNLSQDEVDDTFESSNVRLQFDEFISGDNNGGMNVFPGVNRIENGIAGRLRCCRFFRLNKAVILICTLILTAVLIGGIVVLLSQVGENNTEGSSLDVCIIPDMLNISYEVTTGNPVDEISTQSPHVIVRKIDRQYPGVFTLKGHWVNQTMLEEVFHFARKLLKTKLNGNSTKTEILSWKGEIIAYSIDVIRNRLNITSSNVALDGMFEDTICERETEVTCNATGWYRSINGICNNMIYKSWGSQYSPFRRILHPDNSKSKESSWVPTYLSEQLTGGTPKRDPEASALLPIWAMFILHDTVTTADSPVPCSELPLQLNSNIDLSVPRYNFSSEIGTVCGVETEQNALNEKLQCYAPSPCFAKYPACKLGPRTSFNLATSYIDASNIYGSSEDIASTLRSKMFGKMNLVKKFLDDKGYLPFVKNCNFGTGRQCYLSGDDNVGQLSALTALHTLFVRQHNFIASWLYEVNGHWDDERLFQESRRIVIAQIQHITYNEFLPQILGSSIMKCSKLRLKDNHFDSESYDSKIDASVSDAFVGAMGYFWYSMAVGKLQSIWKKGKQGGRNEYNISLQILNPELIESKKGHLEAVIRGVQNLAVNSIGLQFAPELRSLHLKPLKTNLDLVKWVLEAGRSLQLPPYIEWRKKCGFSKATTRFEDLKQHWSAEAYSRITKVYSKVEDVDLFIGMLAENPVPPARVGPVLACLLADQFLRLKWGDRFWYENDVYFHHFTESQLRSIRRTTLGRILCDNTNQNFEKTQKWPMLLTSPQSNSLLSCSDLDQLPRLKFHLWKDNPNVPKTYSDSNSSEDEGGGDEYISESEESTNSTTLASPISVSIPIIRKSPGVTLIKLLNITTTTATTMPPTVIKLNITTANTTTTKSPGIRNHI